MLQPEGPQKIIRSGDVREYFKSTVTDAVTKQHVDARATTLDYIVELLAGFTRTEKLFEASHQGSSHKPLALLYFQALQSETENERNRTLRRLGDVALFISGLFTDSLNRKPIDVDYYIAMGGNAYGYLADNIRTGGEDAVLRDTFGELSSKFGCFVDVLMEVAEQGRPATQGDVLKLYDLWSKTGSKRAEGQLRNLGIVPVKISKSQH